MTEQTKPAEAATAAEPHRGEQLRLLLYFSPPTDRTISAPALRAVLHAIDRCRDQLIEVGQVASIASVEPAVARRAVSILENLGLLFVDRNDPLAKGRQCRYAIVWSALAARAAANTESH